MSRKGISRAASPLSDIVQQLHNINQEAASSGLSNQPKTDDRKEYNLTQKLLSFDWSNTGTVPAYGRDSQFSATIDKQKRRSLGSKIATHVQEARESDGNDSDASVPTGVSDRTYKSRLDSFRSNYSYGSQSLGGDQLLLHEIRENPSVSQRETSTTTAQHKDSHMNIVMLLGLITGLFLSKFLQYLQMYFYWFQVQIDQLQKAILGQQSFWEFCNFDDNSRYSTRTKILLLPIAIIFALLYGFFYFMHFLICFMRAQAPSGLVAFIHNLQRGA